MGALLDPSSRQNLQIGCRMLSGLHLGLRPSPPILLPPAPSFTSLSINQPLVPLTPTQGLLTGRPKLTQMPRATLLGTVPLEKDGGRPALCWTLGGTTPPESGRCGPWYHLIEAFRSETAGCENFRGLCTNREGEPQSSKGLNTEKVLGDIVPPPRWLPLPPILSFQLFLWVPAWVPSALPSSSLVGILAHTGLHPSPRTSVIASPQVPLVPHLSTARVTFLDLKSGPFAFHLNTPWHLACEATSVGPPPSLPTLTQLSLRPQNCRSPMSPAQRGCFFHMHRELCTR